MKRLSKERPPKGKPIVGKLFYGMLALALLAIVCSSPTAALVVALLVFLGTVIYFLWDIYGREVEVFDCGDAIIVRNARREEKIPLSNIASVELMRDRSAIVKVTLHRPCTFGSQVKFLDDSQVRWNPFSYLRESDGVIALRARVEHTTPEALRAQEPKYSHPWGLYLVAAVICWSFVNAPSGPIERFDCTVLEATSAPKNRVNLLLRMKDGSTMEMNSKNRYATGSVIACTRQKHRVTQDFSYEC